MKFSVIIPVYNVERYLRECLESVLSQTFTDFEVLCVDDGSTDGSPEILREYAAKDERVNVLRQENMGVSAARNSALNRIKGEYFTFLDADDVLQKSALEDYFRIFTVGEAVDMVCLIGPATFIDGDSFPWIKDETIALFDSAQVRVEDTHDRVWDLDTEPGFTKFAYSRSSCGDVRFKNYRYGEDRLYLTECLYRADQVASAYCSVYGYRLRPGSAMAAASDGMIAMQALRWRADSIRIMKDSAKIPPMKRARELAQSILGPCTLSVLTIPGRDRLKAFSILRGTWINLNALEGLPIHQRLIVRILSLSKSIVVAIVVAKMWQLVGKALAWSRSQ